MRKNLVVTAVMCTAWLGASACTRATSGQEPARELPPPREDGVVHLPEASRSFVEVQDVTGAGTSSVVAAPARVDFRDGAVSDIGVPLDGRIIDVHVVVGQHVRAGESLVTLDCPEAATLRASATSANASLREARLDLERQERMRREGVGIERDVIATETKVSAAEAEVSRIATTIASLGPGAASAVVIRAPIAGVVITRKASVGLAVQHGGDPLLEIGDTSAVRIVADVFERDLPHVRAGAKARVTFPSINRDMATTVSSVGTVVTPGLRTAPVFLGLDAHGADIRPGMYGRVEIDAGDSGITLPVEAVLIRDGKDPVVYVQTAPLTFTRRRVVVAQPVQGRVQIVSGLTPGEKVVVHGALLLDGAADQML